MKKGLILIMCFVMFLSLTACNQKKSGQEKDVLLSDIHTAVKKAYGETYLPSMPYDETQLKDLFGISKEMYEQVVAEGPKMSVHVDTFVAVKAKEGQADAVEEALNQYKTNNIQQSLQYPMNLSKVNGAKIHRIGNYVFFIQLGEIPAEAEEQGEEAAIKAAEEQNQIAVDAIDKLFE